MEIWLWQWTVFFTISICVLGSLLFRRRYTKNLPPGPSLISSFFFLLTNSLSELEPIVKNLKSKYGPIFNLSIGFHPSIFIGSHSLAHQILIQKGAIFSDRPKSFSILNISTAPYGPTWRLLRRNLSYEILHPSRSKSYSDDRKWVLHILIRRLQEQKQAVGIRVYDHFRYAMFCLLVVMCFGEKLDEDRINEIVSVQRRWLLFIISGRLSMLGVFPRLGKIIFRNTLKELLKLRSEQEEVLIPLIKARIESANSEKKMEQKQSVTYVDTLVKLQLPKEGTDDKIGEKLTLKEMTNMCQEFLNGGTDTTSTALQWIMANLVKYPHIQEKLYDEIVAVVGPLPPPEVEPEPTINEEDLQRMKYLKAVVLEGLRRHPPGHLVLPHRVSKEVEVEGFTIPEGSTINFMVAEMGLDPKVWEDPMEFKPERFLGDDVFDISGSKGIKMMPFGAGRRICPGSDLALLHLEYFVSNLIWHFHWSAPEGYCVDLSEKFEFTVVMKDPLKAKISSRAEKMASQVN